LNDVNDNTPPQRRSGLARAASLTPEERRISARKAAYRRWGVRSGTEEFATALISEYAEIFQDRPDLFVDVSLPLLEWAYASQVANGMQEVAVRSVLSKGGEQ